MLFVIVVQSKGKYIARQDADDISYPSRLMEQVKVFANNSALIVLATRGLIKTGIHSYNSPFYSNIDIKYKIKLRNEGGFNQRYGKKYSSIHRGMLHIVDVPGFEYILIHVGNSDEHTAGCLLVGDSQENNQINKNGFIGSSSNAYKRIYPSIAEAVEKEGVTIEYIDLD